MSKRLPFARQAAAIGLGFSLIAGSLVAPTVAHAEGEIRIAEQFGIVYLLLNVVRDQNLIEKYGKQEGIDIKVDWTQLSGGSAVNDALLSGSIDIAGAGVGRLSGVDGALIVQALFADDRVWQRTLDGPWEPTTAQAVTPSSSVARL